MDTILAFEPYAIKMPSPGAYGNSVSHVRRHDTPPRSANRCTHIPGRFGLSLRVRHHQRSGPLQLATSSKLKSVPIATCLVDREVRHEANVMGGDIAKDVMQVRRVDPETGEVAVRTRARQAVLALHRVRQQLVKFCTMQINSPRGLLTEYGEAMSVGRVALEKVVVGILERLARRRPALPRRATRSLATALRVRVPSSAETLVRKLEEHTTFRDSFSTFCSLPSTISRASFSSGSQTASAAVASTRRVSREPTQFLLTLIVDRSDENQTTLGQSVLPPYTSLLANHPVPLGFCQ